VTITLRRPRTVPAKAATVLGIGTTAAVLAGALPFTAPSHPATMAPVVVIASVAHLVAGRLVRAGRMARGALLASTTLLVILATLTTHGSSAIHSARPLWTITAAAFGLTAGASLWMAMSRPRRRLPWNRETGRPLPGPSTATSKP
jgi:hypothetical protein